MATNDPVVDKLIADAEAAVEAQAGITSVISAVDYAAKTNTLCAVPGTDKITGERAWIICLALDDINLIPLARAIIGREDITRFEVDNSVIISNEEFHAAVEKAQQRKMY